MSEAQPVKDASPKAKAQEPVCAKAMAKADRSTAATNQCPAWHSVGRTARMTKRYRER